MTIALFALGYIVFCVAVTTISRKMAESAVGFMERRSKEAERG